VLAGVARDLAVDVERPRDGSSDHEYEQRHEIGPNRKGARSTRCQMARHGCHSTLVYRLVKPNG
jgi:hypothetical protein